MFFSQKIINSDNSESEIDIKDIMPTCPVPVGGIQGDTNMANLWYNAIN